MEFSRRQFLYTAACAAGCLGVSRPLGRSLLRSQVRHTGSITPRTHSITPVVFDGIWNWREEPAGESGYLDPREFEIKAGIRWISEGEARNLRGSTPVPIAFPEQELSDVRIENPEDCAAKVVALGETAAQLQVHAPVIRHGQTITATVIGRVKLYRHCPHYSAEQFPAGGVVPPEIAADAIGNSPGIRCETTAVRRLAEEISSRHDLPWNRARKFFDWVWENIEGHPGAYTSVEAALKHRCGDCEERAGVFVALCRAAEIPARLVLVPNHCWAEFCLIDGDGAAHWIPAHTAAYNWFGWTGAHELVLQKGDRIHQPGSDSTVRLVSDWWSYEGRKPRIEYFGELTPVEGPGKRVKNAQGGWDLDGGHPDDRFLRS